jgi:hypothetical protein
MHAAHHYWCYAAQLSTYMWLQGPPLAKAPSQHSLMFLQDFCKIAHIFFGVPFMAFAGCVHGALRWGCGVGVAVGWVLVWGGRGSRRVRGVLFLWCEMRH